jgi:hypothetical protein
MPTKHQIRVPQSEEKNEKEMDCHTVFAGADHDLRLRHNAPVDAFLGRIQAAAEAGG